VASLGLLGHAPTSTNGTWVNQGVWPSATTTGVFHLFAISQVLTAVPEPSILWMAGPALLAVAASDWSGSRRDHRRQRRAGPIARSDEPRGF